MSIGERQRLFMLIHQGVYYRLDLSVVFFRGEGDHCGDFVTADQIDKTDVKSQNLANMPPHRVEKFLARRKGLFFS